jgi:hypothetical protein
MFMVDTYPLYRSSETPTSLLTTWMKKMRYFGLFWRDRLAWGVTFGQTSEYALCIHGTGLLCESFPGFLFESFLLPSTPAIQFTTTFTLFMPRHKKFTSSLFYYQLPQKSFSFKSPAKMSIPVIISGL